jgi:ABC-type antimicrobial peptide transport system permease subunit
MNGLLLFELGAGLATALGLLGLILAIVGLYGVMSYAVSQRTQEIGIRMALGAQPGDVLRMVGRQGLRIAAIGIMAGWLAAFGVGRLAGDFIVGVTPNDPVTYLSVSILLAAVALLASYVPANRAARIEPNVALRYE